MRRSSLQRRLTAGGALLIAVTAGAVAGLSHHMTRHFLAERYLQHLQVLAEYAAQQAELGLLLNDQAMLHAVAHNLLQQKEVTAVAVLDPRGTPLVSLARRPPSGQDVTVEVTVRSQVMDPAAAGPEGHLDQRGVGTLRLSCDVSGFRELVRGLIVRYAALSMAVTAMAAVVYGWIARSLTVPLRNLEAAADQVSRGHLSVRAEGGALRETHRVATAFNTMLEALEERQAALERLNKHLARQEVLAQLGRFSTMVAHEIKNPLTILRGSLEALKRPDPTGETHAMVVRFMEEELQRIDRLVQDFLGFARPVKPQRQAMDFFQWLCTVVEKFQLMAPEGYARILCHTDPHPAPCHADPQLLEQALGHLIRNALDVSPAGATVRVRAYGEEPRWCVEVADEGPGIPQEHEVKIFEPFFTTKAKGSGLGLAMVQRIAEGHGGGVEYLGPNPETETGAVFRLWLPM